MGIIFHLHDLISKTFKMLVFTDKASSDISELQQEHSESGAFREMLFACLVPRRHWEWLVPQHPTAGLQRQQASVYCGLCQHVRRKFRSIWCLLHLPVCICIYMHIYICTVDTYDWLDSLLFAHSTTVKSTFAILLMMLPLKTRRHACMFVPSPPWFSVLPVPLL